MAEHSHCWSCEKPWHLGSCEDAPAAGTPTCPGCPHPVHGDEPCKLLVPLGYQRIHCLCDVYSRAKGVAQQHLDRQAAVVREALENLGWRFVGFDSSEHGRWLALDKWGKRRSASTAADLIHLAELAEGKAKAPRQEGFGW